MSVIVEEEDERALKMDIRYEDRELFEKEYKEVYPLKYEHVAMYYNGDLPTEPFKVFTVYLRVEDHRGSLIEYVRGEIPSVAMMDTKTMMWQMCLGLEHLHQKGFVHGYLTPGNVLASRRGARLTLLKLAFYGFRKWRPSNQEIDKANDVLGLGKLCAYVATKGNWDGVKELTTDDLVGIPEENIRYWALKFLQTLMDPDKEKRPSSWMVLSHPFLVVYLEAARTRLCEMHVYDELLKPFSPSELQNWYQEVDPDLRRTIGDTENLQTLDTIINDLWSKPNDFSEITQRALKEIPHYFAHFAWRAMNCIDSQPRIVFDGPVTLSFSSAIKGTWIVNGSSQRVALKKGKWGSDDESPELKNKRFLKEIEDLRQIDYMFVVKYLGSITRNSFKHVVMELCDGNLRMYSHRLIESIHRGSVEEKWILGQAITGLGYLHSRNIVHGDIRPDSILLWRHPRGVVIVKLTSFGLSKPQPLDTSDYSTSTLLGSKGYIAPEMLTVEPDKAQRTFETDVWALGVVFYFTVTRGEHPFGYRNPMDPMSYRVEMIRRTNNLRNVSRIAEYWDAADLIDRLMARQPEDRPNVFTLLLHPFFSLTNEWTKRYFAHKMCQMGNRSADLLSSATARNVTDWYSHFNKDLTSINDPGELAGLVKSLERDPMEVDGGSGLSQNLHPKEIYHLVSKYPKIFTSFLWSSMLKLKMPRDECCHHFQMSPMKYGMIHMPTRHFRELWTINGADKNQSEMTELTNLAATLSCPMVMRVLLNGISRQTVQSISVDGTTPLHLACQRTEEDAAELVEFLLVKGADPNAVDKELKTPLHYAAEQNLNSTLYDLLVKKQSRSEP